MSYKHNLLLASYPFIRIINTVKNGIGVHASKRLRVLVYHDVPPDCINDFSEQIKWLSKRWEFIDAQRFGALITGEQPLVEDSLLLTFDDGFYSNYIVAETILDPLNIRAIFFVVSDFIDAKSVIESRNFIARDIRVDMLPSMMPPHWKNMSWADLRNLQARGHTIGAHTATHPKLSTLVGDLAYEKEIVTSADLIENMIEKEVLHFAFTFGDFSSLSYKALAVAKSRFPYIYTSLRGDNATNLESRLICRDTISPYDKKWLVGSFLEGGADRVYKESRVNCCSWLN